MQRQVIRWTKDAYAAPWVQGQKVAIAADDRFCAGRQGKFQVDIVLGIPAVGDMRSRLKPNCGRPEQVKDVIAPRSRNNLGELRTAKHLGNLSIDWRGQRKNVGLLCMEQRPLRHAVSFQCRTDKGRCVKDDQPAARRVRRSAL